MEQQQRHPLIRLRFSHLTVASVLLPLGGVLCCLLLSLLLHYDQSTKTVCGVKRNAVPNYLPSISASVSLVPERYVWRACVGLHSAPRYLTSAAYFALYRRRFPAASGSDRGLRALAGLNLACGLAENTALLALTYVSSLETYVVHEKAVESFMASSALHASLTCALWRAASQRSRSRRDVVSYRRKLALAVLHVTFTLAAVYLFVRHRRRCEAGVYTMFATVQLLLMATNMGFHATAFWDFRDQEVVLVVVGGPATPTTPEPVVVVAAATPGD